MAGDYIQMRTGLASEKATLQIIARTGLDQFQVVGRLHAVWSWAGEHTVTGEVRGVTLEMIDHIACAKGFGEAMLASEWLENSKNGVLKFPNWKKYNGKCARKRINDATRALKYRRRKRDGERDAPRDGERPTEHNITEQNVNVRSFDGDGGKWEFEFACLKRIEARHLDQPGSICAMHRALHGENSSAIKADEPALLEIFAAAAQAVVQGKRNKSGLFRWIVSNPSRAKMEGDAFATARAQLKIHRARIAEGAKMQPSWIPLCDEVKP